MMDIALGIRKFDYSPKSESKAGVSQVRVLPGVLLRAAAFVLETAENDFISIHNPFIVTRPDKAISLTLEKSRN
jgi:hypothetical protein